jgi:hypothetical protein
MTKRLEVKSWPVSLDSVRFKERDTDLLYDAQIFEDGVLVRSASPGFSDKIEMISIEDFEERFDEYYGRTN